MESALINANQLLETVPIDIPLEKIGEKYAKLRMVNPPEEKLMSKSLEKYGQLSPIVVCIEGKKKYELLDGFKRLHSSRKLSGVDHLKARAVSLKDHACKASILLLNSTGRIAGMEEAMIVHSLYNEDSLTQVEIGTLLNRHKSWVSRRLSLVDQLCEEVLENLRLGLIGTRIAQEITKLPRGNQEAALLAIQKHNLTTREAGLMVSGLLSHKESDHDDILNNPKKFIDGTKQNNNKLKSNGLSQAGQIFYNKLLSMEDFCLSVAKTNITKELSHIREEDLYYLFPVIERVIRSGKLTIDNLEKVLTAYDYVKKESKNESQ